MIGVLGRALWYSAVRPGTNASDEHRLFPAVDLPPVPGARPLPQDLSPLAAVWRDRLAQTKTRSFLVVRGGTLTGRYDAPGDTPDRPGRLYSVTKSVLSLAWGIADAEGLVPGLDEPVFRGLTPRNLLRMDSGLGFDEGFDRLNRQVFTYLHPNARHAARRGRLEEPLGKDFRYNDFHSLLLGVLLDEGLAAAGWNPAGPVRNRVAGWVYDRLLAPLGLEHPGRWVVDSARHGFVKTESGLALAASDVARLGLLVLGGGVWEGRRLVPEAWLARSTDPGLGWAGAEPFTRYRNLAWGPWLSTGRGAYGWHWWLRPEAGTPPTVFALGIHGQLLVISPRHQAVVVRLADRWALKDWWPEVILEALDRDEL